MYKFEPLIHNFSETTIWKAFILNSIVTALVAFTAVLSRDIVYDKIKNKLYVYLITVSLTFLSAIMSYYIMYFVFGFGKGLLA